MGEVFSGGSFAVTENHGTENVAKGLFCVKKMGL